MILMILILLMIFMILPPKGSLHSARGEPCPHTHVEAWRRLGGGRTHHGRVGGGDGEIFNGNEEINEDCGNVHVEADLKDDF